MKIRKFFRLCSAPVMMLSGCISGNEVPRLVAHRGESAFAPENTIPAYELAWKNGRCWAVETDVYLTKDNVLVCCHDHTTKRTTGVDWSLSEKTFAELRTLDAGSFKSPMWSGVKLPSLQEVFHTIPKDGHIFVEIKSAGPNFAKAYEEARIAGGVTNDQVTIISFTASELKNVRKMLPEVRTLLLIGGVRGKDGKYGIPTAEELLQTARELDVTGVDVEKDFIDAGYVRKFHDAGFEFHVWTVDSPEVAARMISCGVDSITTNRSKDLYQELK